MTAQPEQIPADLTVCDREPIHIPGSIQPHGALVAVDRATGRVTHASANVAAALGLELAALLGRTLPEQLQVLPAAAESRLWERNPTCVGAWDGADGIRYQVVVHSHNGHWFYELERDVPSARAGGDLYATVRGLIADLQRTADTQELMERAVEQVRELTGFDRALVYRFDEDWHGTVVAESRNDRLPSYLGLRFPASDIPRQARELYRLNRVRLIADVAYVPVPVLAAPEAAAVPLDLSFSVLRSVSPVHVEYMRNMGTPSSMSVSIVYNGELWGLISCHHAEARHVSLQVRTACDLLSQVLSLQVAALAASEESEQRLQARGRLVQLLGRMAELPSFVDGLRQNGPALLDLVAGQGVAIMHDRGCWLVGDTPDEDVVRSLADRLTGEPHGEVWATAQLGAIYPDLPSAMPGVMAIRISELEPNFVIWFRREQRQVVRWGGDPRKPAAEHTGRIHPRHSFDVWEEVVQGRSLQWSLVEREAARDLRDSLLQIVLRRAEELAHLTRELERSNKELEAFSYSVSHDLRAPFRHIVGFGELLREFEGPQLSERGKRYLENIISSGYQAGTLVDSLLTFARIGRAQLHTTQVDLGILFAEVRREMEPELAGREIEWRIGALPQVRGDSVMLRTVVRNLLSNAVKYTRGRTPAVIEVQCDQAGSEYRLAVKDNGVGFDMRYAGKLFGVFQRLHRPEEFEGTGIGLANVRRIIQRHGGQTWAEGELDKGATVFFTLPVPALDQGPVAAGEPDARQRNNGL